MTILMLCLVTAAGSMGSLWINGLREQVAINGFVPETNNHCEAFFKVLKYFFVEKKVTRRVHNLLCILVDRVGPYFDSKCRQNAHIVSREWTARAYDREVRAELLIENGSITILDPVQGTAAIRSSKDETKIYQTCLAPPTCTCSDTEGILCKHVRALARELGGLEHWNLNVLDSFESTNRFERFEGPSTKKGSLESSHLLQKDIEDCLGNQGNSRSLSLSLLILKRT